MKTRLWIRVCDGISHATLFTAVLLVYMRS